MKSMLKRFVKEEQGLEMVEYAVLVALVVAGLVLAINVLLPAVKAAFTTAADQIN